MITASGLMAAAAVGRAALPGSPSAPVTAVSRPLAPSDERSRLENIAFAHRAIRKCLRQQQTLGYLAGQAIYNLGEYPALKPWEITDDDERRLDELASNGIELIQVHSEWSDEERLFGSDKYRPANDAGFRRFIDACHRRHIKIIPYVSACYFGRRDPDFKPEWALNTGDTNELWYHLAHCSPASPSWRNYLLPRIRYLLDEYGVDGVYNDVGYAARHNQPAYRASDEVLAFEETPDVHGSFEDLLGIIYDDVKRRGGVVKLHAGLWYRNGVKPPSDRRLFDYMWVGESVDKLDTQREQLKNHPPYLVPCPYYALLEDTLEKVGPGEIFMQAIPYMQFPLLGYGKPFTGERGSVPGIEYAKDPDKPGRYKPLAHMARVREYYLKNPHSRQQAYSSWDAIGGGQDLDLHFRLLKIYRRMVLSGSWVFTEISDAELWDGALPQNVVASAFVNDGFYLAVANYGTTAAEVALRDHYLDLQHDSRTVGGAVPLVLPPRSLQLLEKSKSPAPRTA